MEFALDSCRRSADRRVVGHIQFYGVSVETARPQFRCGEVSTLEVARAEQYGHTLFCELAGNLESHALVGTCDQCNFIHDSTVTTEPVTGETRLILAQAIPP